MTEPASRSVIAMIADYDDLIEALRERAADLGLSYDAIDARAGLQSGYTAKLLGPGMTRKLGPVSLGALLGSLCLIMTLVEDEDATARIRRGGVIRAKKQAMLNRLSMKAISRYIQPLSREFARRGGKASAAKRAAAATSKKAAQARRAQARRAALARWGRAQLSRS